SVSAADDAALRALAQELYADYAKKDLDGFLRLWSAKSPEFAARRQTMQKLFADHEKIEVKNLALHKITVTGEKAKLRVEVEIIVIEAKTGKPSAEYGKMIRALQCVKEEGAWKTWREALAVEDLADALGALKTDVERTALLTEEKELVTERLVRELNLQGNRLRLLGDYPEALVRFRLGQEIAERISDKAGTADTRNNIGVVHLLQGAYAQALEYFQKSLAVSKELDDKVGVARTLTNIGNVHFRQGAYAQALENFQKSLALSEELDDKGGIARMLNNIGNINAAQGAYLQALEYLQKSLALSEELEDKTGIARALINIGVIHK